MHIRVNGLPQDAREGATLHDLLASLHLDPRRIAVAVNDAVVPRGELATRVLAAGDRIEIIEAVGGG